jgi:hypothetical protein
VGEGSEWIAASDCENEDNGRGSYEAHYVSVGPQEDRCVSACEMGEVEGRKEGSVRKGPFLMRTLE